MFVIASVIHFLGVAFYAVFASGELQPWAEPPKDEEEPVKPAAVTMAPWNPFDPSQQQKVPYSADANNYNTTVSDTFYDFTVK